MVNHIPGEIKCRTCGIGFLTVGETLVHLRDRHNGETNGDFGVRHIKIRTK